MAKTNETDKDKILSQVLLDIEKQFGKGAIMKLGDDTHNEIAVSPSGSLTLDLALGVGGYPKGRIIEIYGPESSGKTTFALHAIAEIQNTIKNCTHSVLLMNRPDPIIGDSNGQYIEIGDF